jgi:hydroxymethylbilane synthase
MLQFLDHPESRSTVTAERSFLHRLEGGCQVPIGGFASLEADGRLTLQGFVADVEGREVIQDAEQGPPEEAAAVGRRLAERILERGGGRILAQVYAS